jgi:hypothetical protein
LKIGPIHRGLNLREPHPGFFARLFYLFFGRLPHARDLFSAVEVLR